MTISFKGTMLVKKIRQGRNGPFCVADLLTEVGEFKAKDPLLDQFDEGEYRGTFWVSEFYLYQYVAFGRAVTEMRVRLQDLQVDAKRDLQHDQAESSEPDPADEPPVPTLQRRNAAQAAKPAANKLKTAGSGSASKKKPTTSLTAEDHALFGDEIFALLQARERTIKLDPTIGDRIRFRNQAARMGTLGYAFRAQTQTWHLGT